MSHTSWEYPASWVLVATDVVKLTTRFAVTDVYRSWVRGQTAQGLSSLSHRKIATPKPGERLRRTPEHPKFGHFTLQLPCRKEKVTHYHVLIELDYLESADLGLERWLTSQEYLFLQKTRDGSQPSETQDPGDPMPTSEFYRYQGHIYAGKPPTYKINKS